MSVAFSHQIDGARWLARRQRAILGDTPGLGKTRTALLGLLTRGYDLTGPGVICPASALNVWEREAAAINAPRPVALSFDAITRRGLDWAREQFDERPIIVDEFHRGRIMSSQRTQWLFGNDGLVRHWGWPVWLLSGTPSVRNPFDLWPALCAGWPDLMAHYGFLTAEQWKARTCEVQPRSVWRNGRFVWEDKIVGVKDAAVVNEILSRTMLRRTLDDVGLDVPAVFHQELPVLIKNDEDDMDEEVVKRLFFDAQLTGDGLEAIKNDTHWARYRRRLGEAKVQPLIAEMREQLENSDEKVVIFAHHTSVLEALANAFALTLAYVDGSVPTGQRTREIARFQTDPQCRVFVGQNHACAESITLTAARRVLLLEPDPVAGVNAQLVQRVARIGSTASRCIAQWVVAEGTLDRQIVAQNIRETEMVESTTPSTAAVHAETR